MKNRVIKEIVSWVIVIVIAVGLALFINKVVIYKLKIPTGSMENTIQVGDKVWTFRLSYLFSKPKRGDIVVFPYPDDESEDYIKRVIGLPGETIEGKDGIVYIDGEPLEEDYLKEEWDMNTEFGPYEIPEGKYFMMGDNRNWSKDARDWDIKFVDKDKIRGKAILKYPKFQWLN